MRLTIIIILIALSLLLNAVMASLFFHAQETTQQLSSQLKKEKTLRIALEDDIDSVKNALAESNARQFKQRNDLLIQIESLQNDKESALKKIRTLENQNEELKNEMGGWQKDYVTALAGLEKSIVANQEELESVKEGIRKDIFENIAVRLKKLEETCGSLTIYSPSSLPARTPAATPAPEKMTLDPVRGVPMTVKDILSKEPDPNQIYKNAPRQVNY